MYGFSGYATDGYATRRLFGSFIPAPLVQLATTVARNTYAIVSNFKSTYGVNAIVRSTYNLANTFKNTYGIGSIVRLLFRNTTLEI